MSRVNRNVGLLLILSLSLILCLGACDSKDDQASQNAPARQGDDDDDFLPPPADDDADDDDAADDDDTGDDDDDDTGEDPGPVITITTPENNATYNDSEIEVVARVENADWDTIQCTFDSEDITDLLTISNDQGAKGYDFDITGKIDGAQIGWHNFRIIATNEEGTRSETAVFKVEIEGAYLELSLSTYMTEPEQTVTASVTVFDGNGDEVSTAYDLAVNPNSGFSRDGDDFVFHELGSYNITASAQYGGKLLLADTETVVIKDLTPASVNVVLSSDETNAGVAITANATVYNSFDEPLDGWWVAYTVTPGTGVTVQGRVITMTKAVPHQIQGTVQGTTISETEDCDVHPGDAAVVNLTVFPTTINAGGSVLYNATVEDLYGNVIDDEDATISVTPSDGFSIDGQTITFDRARVTPYTVRAQYTHIYDTKDVQVNDTVNPRIVWTSPDRGYITVSTGVTLLGQVIENESAISDFSINGMSVATDPEGNFIHVISSLEYGLNIIEAEARDEFDNYCRATISVLRGNLLPDDSVVEDAMGVRINQGGLDQIEQVAGEFIADFDFDALLDPYLPLEMGEPGDTLYIYADLTNVAFGTPVIDLIPQWGGLNLQVTIPDVDIDGYVDVSIGGGDPTRYTLEITGPSITAGANVLVSVDEGALSVSVEGFSLDLTNVTVLINGYDNPALVAMIEMIINQMLTELLEEELPALIEELLGSLDLTFEETILGVTYTFNLEFASVDFGVDGGTIWLDGQVLTDTVDPNTRDLDGSLLSPGATPIMDIYTPGGHVLYGFGAAIGDEFLNQALYQFFRSGLLTLHINNEWAQDHGFAWDLTTTDLALFLPGLADLYPDTPLEFWLDPQLPPVIVYDAGGPVDALNVELQLGDLLMDLKVVPEEGDPVTALGIAVSVKIPLELNVNPDTQTLEITFGTPVVCVDIYESQFIFFPYHLLEELIPLVVELALPLLSDFIDEIPIPIIQGFTLNVVETSVFGYYSDFLGLFGDLVLVPEE